MNIIHLIYGQPDVIINLDSNQLTLIQPIFVHHQQQPSSPTYGSKPTSPFHDIRISLIKLISFRRSMVRISPSAATATANLFLSERSATCASEYISEYSVLVHSRSDNPSTREYPPPDMLHVCNLFTPTCLYNPRPPQFFFLSRHSTSPPLLLHLEFKLCLLELHYVLMRLLNR